MRLFPATYGLWRFDVTDTMYYFLIGIIALAAITITVIINRKRSADRLRRSISAKWGNIPAEQYKDGDMKAISGYYANLAEIEDKEGTHFIDDITWNDLDMDNVFKRINNTQSTVGEEFLYSLLRKPDFDPQTLEKRDRYAEFFRTNPAERAKLQFILARLGKNRYAGISDIFCNNERSSSKKGLRYILLLIIFLLSPVILVINFPVGIIYFVASFFTNMTVYYKAKNDREQYMNQLNYLINLTVYSRKIADAGIPGIEEYTGTLRSLLKKIKGVSIKSFYQIFYNTNDIFLEPIKVVFLVELISFESLLKKVYKYRHELHSLYETVGLLDSLVAIASYRESLEYYTVPTLYKYGTDNPKAISFKDAYHPLIKEPVVNSLDISTSVLITGSNASGKSTFLKTAAINAVFAQTINTCLAGEYKSCYFRIFTSMALKDNLSSNESYYIAEIKSLKRILDKMDEYVPILCMIDEVLRGTNTIERIAASSEVLQHLGGSNCICIAATHDLELTSILKRRYCNFHFQESFKDNDIVFDYKIYPGKSTTRNAIKLLKIMGYADDIVRTAEERAERFSQEGRWTDS